MIPRLIIIALTLLTPVNLFAQNTENVTKESRASAALELETIIIEAKKLDNKNALVNVRSRAAMLVSFSDPGRSENMFLEVWKFVNDQAADNDFDKTQAKLVILKYLFPRNPKLARQLVAEQAKPEESSSQSPAAGGDNDQRMAGKLASQLVDADPSAAASLLEKSMSVSATSAAMGALSRLREKDSFLSDYVVAKVLDGLTTQPTRRSLAGFSLLTAYVFPGPDAPISSIEAESSLQSLQFKYFLIGYELLKASLTETNEVLLKDQHYTQRDLLVRAAYQGQIAAILAALAPRLQPSLSVEMTAIAGKLAPQIPANISQLSQFSVARLSGKFASEDPEQSLFFALSNGDFDEARKQLDRLKDDKKKDIYSQLIFKNQAKALLAQSDVMGALTAIRKIEDQTVRLVMYLEAIKAVKKKHDSDLTKIVINEARLLIPQTDRNGLHVRALLSFVSQLTEPGTNEDAMEFLNLAVVSINTLAKRPNEESAAKTLAESAMAELNDPNSLLDASELDQAFSLVGLRDLEQALTQARRIEPRAVQLVARLETIQGVIKRPPSKPKVTPKPPNG
jgi:hypothetical protein